MITPRSPAEANVIYFIFVCLWREREKQGTKQLVLIFRGNPAAALLPARTLSLSLSPSSRLVSIARFTQQSLTREVMEALRLPSVATRAEAVYMAKLAEQAERYEGAIISLATSTTILTYRRDGLLYAVYLL